MSVADVLVLVGAAGLTASLAWFFFGPKRARRAELVGGVQQVEIVVRGGYEPSVVRARQGVPLRMVFDRQEVGDCTSRVVLADFGVNRALPAHARTDVDLVPTEAGTFTFACGMNMVHGTLLVEPAGTAPGDGGDGPGIGAVEVDAPVPVVAASDDVAGEPASGGDAEAAERRAA
jgi:P-type Cu+ transporter